MWPSDLGEEEEGRAVAEAYRLSPDYRVLDFDLFLYHVRDRVAEGFALEASVEDETQQRLVHYEFFYDERDEPPHVKSFISLHNHNFTSMELSVRRSLLALHSVESNIIHVFQLKDDGQILLKK